MIDIRVYQNPESLRGRSTISGCSAGMEFGVVAVMPPGLKSSYPNQEKYLVSNLRYRDPSPEEPFGAFEVTDDDEQVHVVVPTQSVDPFPAGGSINSLFVLRHLGVSDTAVVFAGGNGERTKGITKALEGRVQTFLLPAKGADTTLTVRGQGGSTLLCRKREPLSLSEELLMALRNSSTKLLMLTSVKPSNLESAKALVEGQAQYRTFMPHISLIKSMIHRDQMLDLVAQSDMIQFNAKEAATFLGQDNFKEVDISKMLSELPLKDGALVIVTMDEKGAYLFSKSADQIFVPAIVVPPEQVVETSGPGDGLGAIFSRYKFLTHDPFSNEDALKLGVWGASHLVQNLGSWRGVPKHDQRVEAISRIKHGEWPINV